jgi:uncharacterized cupredoxin-like copper-binding protein
MRPPPIPLLLLSVSLAASGCGGGDKPTEPAATPAERTEAVAMSELRFSPRNVTAASGSVLAIHNAGKVGHDFKLRRDGQEVGGTPILNPGQTLNLEVRYPPGRYELYCSVPGHEKSGMRGTFIVE